MRWPLDPLGYLAEESLAGNPLKESIEGAAVFGRDPGYNPRVRRSRAKLAEYYPPKAPGSVLSSV